MDLESIIIDSNDPENIELRSPKVQEIMNKPPRWIVSWGITVIAVVIAVILFLTWKIKYPEIIPARISLTTSPPPIRLVSSQSGKLVHIWVHDQEEVKEGAYLAVLESSSNYEDVFLLEKQLDTLSSWLSGELAILPKIEWKLYPRLGEIQSTYSRFREQYEQQNFFHRSKNYRIEQLQNLTQQVANLEQLNANLNTQIEIFDEEIKLIEREKDINNQLFEEGAISRLKADKANSSYLYKKRAAEQLKGSIFSNRIQKEEYEKRIAELKQGSLKERQRLDVGLGEMLKELKAAVDQWKKNYLFEAPFDGQITFSKIWAENQYIKAGEEVMSLVPPGKEIIGKAFLPIQGAGKVSVGQKVNIKLDSYNFERFGMLLGEVSSISPIPQGENYSMDIKLVDGMKTTYDKRLVFTPEMSGQADIITEDLRLIERIFIQMRKILSQSNQQHQPEKDEKEKNKKEKTTK
ncbi:MAG: HlyD family secretion protein [Bacteroidia bacterium]|nr:HlyD family secretion protein [Bacteroidia bacterium]